MSRILIVEDDTDINRLLQKILQKEGYTVTAAFSGTEAQLRFSMESFDLILCDLMIPGISGEELIAEIRQSSNVPIIALTAKLAMDDKVNVLEIGADDYVTKPFEPRELVVRIKAQLRRSGYAGNKTAIETETDAAGQQGDTLVFRDITLHVTSRVVTVKDVEIELTAHEFDLLQVMMEKPGNVFSKDSLYEAVWKNGYYGEDNTVSVHISNLRKKIAAVTEEEYIQTVWGIGYRLR